MKPRYAELAEQLIQAIGDGTFQVGSALPSEVDLSVQYGVSRATVRSALERVQELGLSQEGFAQEFGPHLRDG